MSCYLCDRIVTEHKETKLCNYCHDKYYALRQDARWPDLPWRCSVCHNTFSLFSDCMISDGCSWCPQCKKKEKEHRARLQHKI